MARRSDAKRGVLNGKLVSPTLTCVGTAALACRAAALPPNAPPAADIDGIERRNRLEALARRQRGLAGTVATSPRGLLLLSDNTLQRKSLLGE
jgi:hypothetical protein